MRKTRETLTQSFFFRYNFDDLVFNESPKH